MEISRCILEDSGMEVTCAVDGQEAVEIFEKSAPDYFGVIYMDVMMPRMNGLDAEKMVALKQCMADNSDVKLHEDL